jgi:predicted phage-related endonuclease
MKRTIHNFEQGSPEWLAHRGTCYNASELVAAMGFSSYLTRSEMLHNYANGAREVDAGTQKRFDDGHRYEKAMRPVAEEIIGQELFPICVSVDVGLARPLGASMDGATMDESITWEHKTMNQALDSALSKGEIPEEYWPQMEQGLMALGATRCLFMASKGTRESMRHAWYESKPEVRAKIIPAWQQFEADLKAYVHKPDAPKAAPSTVVTLPSLVVNVDASEIKVRDNLADFGSCLKAYIALIPESPSTDQEFVDCKEACKSMERAEAALKAAREQVIAQTGTIEMVLARVTEFENLARQTRLRVEKLVTAREAAIKDEIRREGVNAFAAHLVMLNTQLGGEFMPIVQPKFAEAMKGKRTIATLRNAVDSELARAKIEANQAAEKIGKNLAFLRSPEVLEFDFLFADRAQLVQKAPDDFILAVQARIRSHQEAEERKRAEALRPEPAPVAPAEPVRAPTTPAASDRPSDSAIVAAVAGYFGVHTYVAARWLLTLNRADLERASAPGAQAPQRAAA